mmetsp:Transcript_2560/g.6022  ORF Transcript_2560/g.6022 Transcript_2560/m.6022 type:complete len:222 (+) Transcript_2560:569-1234(+)
MEEGAQVRSGTGLGAHITADHGSEVARMVELLFGTVRIGTAQALRAALVVRQAGVFLGPVWARLRPVADGDVAPGILVVVGIDAGLPVVLHPDGAPERLVLVHEEVFGQRLGNLLLLFSCQQLCGALLSGMGEFAGRPATALGDVRVGGAKANLAPRPDRLRPEVITSTGDSPTASIDQQPVGVEFRSPTSQLLSMCKAADLLPTAALSVAPPRLVLCWMV